MWGNQFPRLVINRNILHTLDQLFGICGSLMVIISHVTLNVLQL